MATKNLETVSGLVEQINAKQNGIKVSGQWLNISQYHALEQLPQPGQRVDVSVEKTDRGAWINAVEVLNGGQVHQLPMQQRRGGGGGRSPAELREIRRLTCLKAVATFCGHYATVHEDVKSSDVLVIAEAFERWVLKGPTDG